MISSMPEYVRDRWEAMQNYVSELGGAFPAEVRSACENIAHQGGTPLVVAKDKQVLGVIYLKDIVKGGIKERFSELRPNGHQNDHDHW